MDFYRLEGVLDASKGADNFCHQIKKISYLPKTGKDDDLYHISDEMKDKYKEN